MSIYLITYKNNTLDKIYKIQIEKSKEYAPSELLPFVRRIHSWRDILNTIFQKEK